MIYTKDGKTTQNAYDAEGQLLSVAYSKDGAKVYPALKVMSYNVGQWYVGGGDNVPAAKDAEYYALQNGMLLRDDPDILCIQEYWKVFSKTGRTAKSMLEQYFPYIHEQGGDSGYFGRCVCSKYPITDYTVRLYTGESDRYFDSCAVTVHGTPITVVNTHLGLTQAARDAEIAELIAFLKAQTRFLCCGDFNTVIVYDDPASATPTSQEYIDNVKPFIDEGFHSANFTEFGFLCTQVKNGGARKLCLDTCYTSANIEITAAYTDNTKMNDGIADEVDHLPILAEVII